MSKSNLKVEKIDETTISDHYHLSRDDNCYYLCEYRSDLGFKHPGFQLIQNIKKKVSQRGSPGYHYKQEDIEYVANTLAAVIPVDSDGWVFIPSAPSKSQSDPDYDDRLVRLLESVNEFRRSKYNRPEIEICDCIYTPETRDGLHTVDRKRNPEEVAKTMAVDHSKVPKSWKFLFFFDDMLTTGCTFQASRKVLHREAGIDPKSISGMFIARRIIPPTPPEDDFDIIDLID